MALRWAHVLINICSGIHILIGDDSQTHRQQGDPISLVLFFSKQGNIEIQKIETNV
jgi:hypothetical protein